MEVRVPLSTEPMKEGGFRAQLGAKVEQLRVAA